MLNQTSTTAIARTLLLAGILLAVTVLAARSFFPAFAQEGPIEYAENSMDAVAVYTATDQDMGDILDWDFSLVPKFDLDGVPGNDDEDVFTIVDGVLRFAKTPDYEAPFSSAQNQSLERLNTYTVTITVTDDDDMPAMDSETVVIKVTNVDEPGSVTLSTLQPLEDVPFVATLSDPDGQVDNKGVVTDPLDIDTDFTDATPATTTWQWARSQDGQTGWTNITATSTANEMIDVNTRTPESDDIGHFLRATVTYTDGFGEERRANAVSGEPVLKNLENDDPVFRYTEADADDLPEGAEVGDNLAGTATLTRRLPENSLAGTNVGAPVVAYDEDNDVLTYMFNGEINNDNHNSFEIDRETGQISLKAGHTLDLDYDRGGRQPFTVTVIATDPSDTPDTDESRDLVQVLIEISNILEAPSIAAEDLNAGTGLTTKDHPEQVEPPNTQNPAYDRDVATYSATDDEDNLAGAALTWSLEGDDSDKLEFSSATGASTVLRFKDPQPDYDNPTDRGSNRVYNVRVKVTDSNNMTDTRSVAITIINLDEDGVIGFSHIRPEAGSRITATLDDPDGARGVSWQWYVGNTNTEAEGSGARTATYTPTATDTPSVLIAMASYTDGEGPNKDADERTANGVQNEQDQDADPEFPSDDGSGLTRSVNENSAAGTDVGSSISVSDSDDSDLIFRLGGRDGSSFKLENRTTPLIQVGDNTELDTERKSSYSVTLTAIDPSGDDTSVNVTIDVTNVEERPVFTGGDAVVEVNENSPITTVLDTYTATDDEDRKRNRAVRFILDDNVRFAIGNTSSNRGRLTFTSVRDYEAPASGVNSGTPEQRNTYTVEITARDNGTDGNPAATRDSEQPLVVNVIVKNVDEPGTMTLSTLQPLQDIPLEATLADPDGQAEASGDTRFPINTDLTLHASTTWQWARSQSRTSGWVDIVATTTANPMIDIRSRTPEAADIGHYLRVTATYVDGFGSDRTASAVSAESVRRNLENDRPIFVHEEGNEYTNPAGTVQDEPSVTLGMEIDAIQLRLVRRIDENSSAGANVGDPVTAYDEDGDTLTYMFDESDANEDFGLFEINRRTGQISVGNNTPLDHENDDEDRYTVTVIATDPSDRPAVGNTEAVSSRDDITITIIVEDVEDDPSVTDGADEIAVTEDDVDDDDLTSSITLDDSDISTPVTVDANTGLLELATYTATDDDDRTADPRKELVWTLSGNDSDDFDIATTTGCTNPTDNDCAILYFKGAPNFEAPKDSGGNNIYNVTVVVTDSNGDADTHDVEVTVENVEENGEVTLSHLQPEEDVAIRAELEDPDRGETGVTWQWYVSDGVDQNPEEDVESDWSLISNATSAAYTPVTDNVEKFLRVVATYTDSHENATPQDKDTARLRSAGVVQAKPDANETPQFPDQDPNTAGKQATRMVDENIKRDLNANPPVDGHVGLPIVATDVDTTLLAPAGDVLDYTLGGQDEDTFEIDRTGGQIRLADGIELDYEAEDTYVVTVTATDSSLASDTITVTISVVDKNDKPEIMQRGLVVVGRQRISYLENRTDAVETYSATGADSAGATWSLEGADASAFNITSGGELSFRSSPNFEAATDQGGNNEYNVTVKATASVGNLSMSRNVTVTVTNEDEPGSITFTSLGGEVKVGVEITVELDEGDEETNVTWRWGRTAVDTDPCTAIAGETSNTYTPVEADVDNHLCAMVTYDDPFGTGKPLTFVTEDTVAPETAADTPGTVNLSPSNGLVSADSVTATLTDPDNPTNQVWQWQRSADGSTNWTTISGATSASYTTTNDDGGHYLRASVTYDDSSGTGQTAGPAATTGRVAIDSYDADADGAIDGQEVLQAVRDYFDDVITGPEVLRVVRLYFQNV